MNCGDSTILRIVRHAFQGVLVLLLVSAARVSIGVSRVGGRIWDSQGGKCR
jgi:hypothetical protein